MDSFHEKPFGENARKLKKQNQKKEKKMLHATHREREREWERGEWRLWSLESLNLIKAEVVVSLTVVGFFYFYIFGEVK